MANIDMKIPFQAFKICLCALGLGACVAVHAQSSTNTITNIVMVPWLTIQSQVGTTDQIEYSTDLGQTNWTVLTNSVVRNSRYNFFDLGAASEGTRYYRLVQGTNVSKANSSTAVPSSVNSSVFGQSVTFNATVAAVAPGAGTPTGTVQFRTNGVSFGSEVTLTNGSASSAAVSSLAVGTN